MRKIIFLSLAIAVLVLSVMMPWTTTVWTPISMPGVSGSAGFVGKTSIVWTTVLTIVGVSAILVLSSLFKGKKTGEAI